MLHTANEVKNKTNREFSRACHCLRDSRACPRLRVFPRLSSVTCFPRLFPARATGHTLSRACCPLHFSRACHWLHAFPCLFPVTCFPRLPLVTRFSALAARYMFPALSTGFPALARLLPVTLWLVYPKRDSLLSLSDSQ